MRNGDEVAQVRLQGGCLRLESLPDAEVPRKELLSFRAKFDPRTAHHDLAPVDV
jgi:hypothetical protein